jgi:hypothetical protein
LEALQIPLQTRAPPFSSPLSSLVSLSSVCITRRRPRRRLLLWSSAPAATHGEPGQAIPSNALRASATCPHLAYMSTSAASQKALEQNPHLSKSQCTCLPWRRAPSREHADRTTARPNWSVQVPMEHLMARNASRTSCGDPDRAWKDSTELAAAPDAGAPRQRPSARQAWSPRPDLQ